MAGSSGGEIGRAAGRTELIWGIVSVGVGAGAIVIYAVSADQFASVLASAFMLAAASAVAGGLLGFLFGVPRAAAGPGSDGAPSSRRYRANTNLEQISDWLTKILVGVGLVQFDQLIFFGGRLLRGVAPALGGTSTSVPFGGALLCYFTILGFLGGWLLTQLYLGRALSSADHALDLLLAADQAQQKGADVQAAKFREEAIQLLAAAGDPAGRYESTRRNLPSGPGRTDELERTVSTARHEAAIGRWNADQVRALFDSGRDGDRITALGLMQGDIAHLADLDCVLEAIGESRSGFEQYHALLTAFMLLESLDAGQKQRLTNAVEAQRGPGGHIRPGKERYLLAERILAAR
ncbi:hypothetical protein [Virgisporangium aurantiacum]|uniref:Uncharacterized protein n=1 Tax=Virgisporangium aurantiacum TaxID=175570 RepID=A0A8J3ZFU3_9ACTN|nr:hypothetical protein [Virgisporangium aurantiacum]GIJ63164.1 hypothetical protein Vau01_106800 [Virgisporangium aurantiacum]